MEYIFEKIINNLERGDSINELTSEIRQNIVEGKLDVSNVFLLFISYLKQGYLNENNIETFGLIERYFNGQVSLSQLSQQLFLRKVIVDQDKREGHTAQFRHYKDETILDKILRVIYEFTRSNLVKPKGVCFDFCLFLIGLSIAKKDKRQIYLWNSIEKISGENNFILFCVEDDNIMIYDPFNNLYLPLKEYAFACVGFELIEMNNINLLIKSMDMFSFEPKNMTYYNQIVQWFMSMNNKELDELELLERKNYYERLGVDNNATLDEIKKAFRTIIFKYHPDQNPNNDKAQRMTELVIEAYECLKNEQLRKEYDLRLNDLYSSQGGAQEYSSANRGTSTNNDLDEELQEIIRRFRCKYKFDSYEAVARTFGELMFQNVQRECIKSDIIYYKYKQKNIIDYKINHKISDIIKEKTSTR